MINEILKVWFSFEYTSYLIFVLIGVLIVWAFKELIGDKK